jgi:hypothetical protein
VLRVLLELVRIVISLLFFCGIIGAFINYLYSKFGTNTDTYGWMVFIAMFILFFVLYRNKYQFSGWYTGKGRKKLPQQVSKLLISISILFLILPPILGFLLS